MINELDLSAIDIPYGVLHDSKMASLKCDNNKMVFTFNIEIFPEDYTGDFYMKYKNFKHCDMIVEMVEEPFNYFIFETAINKSGKLKGLDLSRKDFIFALNHAESVSFVECSVSDNEFKIELCIDYYRAKGKMRKYKKYNMCFISLDAKKVSWNWY